jgi:hypothetical protein
VSTASTPKLSLGPAVPSGGKSHVAGKAPELNGMGHLQKPLIRGSPHFPIMENHGKSWNIMENP